MRIKLCHRNLRFETQSQVTVTYRGESIGGQRLDLIVEGAVIVEIKAVRELLPIHQAQILSYLKASGLRAGLLMNFNVKLFMDGFHRFVR